MYPHRIRLRGPWQCEALSADGELATTAVQLPCTFAGSTLLRRRFGYPGRIDDFECVWLTIAGVAPRATVVLNGHAIGTIAERQCTAEFEITSLLQPRNEVILRIDDKGGSCGEVALEVRCTAYLRGITCTATSTGVLVAGEVVGMADRQLEIYVILGRRSAAYRAIAPSPTGTPFCIQADYPPELERNSADAKSMQLDLVNGSAVWYTFEHHLSEQDRDQGR